MHDLGCRDGASVPAHFAVDEYVFLLLQRCSHQRCYAFEVACPVCIVCYGKLHTVGSWEDYPPFGTLASRLVSDLRWAELLRAVNLQSHAREELQALCGGDTAEPKRGLAQL